TTESTEATEKTRREPNAPPRHNVAGPRPKLFFTTEDTKEHEENRNQSFTAEVAKEAQRAQSRTEQSGRNEFWAKPGYEVEIATLVYTSIRHEYLSPISLYRLHHFLLVAGGCTAAGKFYCRNRNRCAWPKGHWIYRGSCRNRCGHRNSRNSNAGNKTRAGVGAGFGFAWHGICLGDCPGKTDSQN